MIDEHNVAAIVGNVGTPTAVVTVPIVNEKKVPFFGAFTGAGVLRKTPPDHYVFNVRASYADETAEMVRGLLLERNLQPEEIAFFTQDDSYNVEDGLATIMDPRHKPRAGIMVGTYKPCAKFIRLAKKLGLNAT